MILPAILPKRLACVTKLIPFIAAKTPNTPAGPNISATKLDQALYIMQMEGYEIYGGGVKQINGHGKQTNARYACKPTTERL